MFSFFKKTKSNIAIPEWASFFSPKEYQDFIAVIEKYFYSHNITYSFGDGVINAGPNDFGFGVMGLINVAQVCKQSESTSYYAIGQEHFGCLIKNYQFVDGFKKIIQHYDQIEQYMGVRLYTIEHFAPVGKENVVVREFSEGIFATLIFDLPNAIECIKPEEVDKWNKSLDELFETGIRNIASKYKFDISLQKFTDFQIWLVQGDHFFTPNVLYELKERQQLVGSYGSLIGMPHRHSVLIYPIENIETVNVINAIIPAINGMFNEGPGSLSPNLFWYHEGVFDLLPYNIEDNAIQFYPPESFLDVLNSFE